MACGESVLKSGSLRILVAEMESLLAKLCSNLKSSLSESWSSSSIDSILLAFPKI